MPLTYLRRFRVRHYECDAYGHLNNVNYLRYMQEATIEASAAAGYDTARYAALGYHWLVRETEIEYLHPLVYGDTVEVKTWVADFRRVRSRRAYELRSLATGELSARGMTDWVYLNTATGEPAIIPGEMILAFVPEGAPPATPRQPRREKVPPPPPGVFRQLRRVRFQDVDPAQHVNNAVYLAYAEDCGFQVAAAFGWPAARMTAEGFAIVPRRHRVVHTGQAVLDDEVEIATWVTDVRRATGARHYALTRVSDGTPLAEIHTLYVWVDRDTLRPIRIPSHFLADFAANISSDATAKDTSA